MQGEVIAVRNKTEVLVLHINGSSNNYEKWKVDWEAIKSGVKLK
jgi:hypothetical protein